MHFFTLIGLTLAAVMVSASPVADDNTGAIDENMIYYPETYFKRSLEDTDEDRSLWGGGSWYGGGGGRGGGWYGGRGGGWYGGRGGGWYGGRGGGWYGGRRW